MGRFPKNEIISLLDVNRRHNLAESTSYDLDLGEVMALVDVDDLKALRLGYGSASGLPQLRELVSTACGVSAGTVLTTQGTALGLFLLAFELCGNGRDAVLLHYESGRSDQHIACLIEHGLRSELPRMPVPQPRQGHRWNG